jgi:hypothetical protein
MNTRFYRYDKYYDEDINLWLKGYMDKKFYDSIYELPYRQYIISLRTMYRPDLIALAFLNNENLAWVLSIVNDIDDSPEGFYPGRIIKVPLLDKLESLL